LEINYFDILDALEWKFGYFAKLKGRKKDEKSGPTKKMKRGHIFNNFPEAPWTLVTSLGYPNPTVP